MAKKRKRRRAEQFPEAVHVWPPATSNRSEALGTRAGVPEWLLPDPPHAAVIEVSAPEEDEEIDAKYLRLTAEIIQRLTGNDTSEKVYEYATKGGVWKGALKNIAVKKNGEPVGWYDLDGGLVLDDEAGVGYLTLYDLIGLGQPLVYKDRKLYIMTEEMWENEEYPSEVGGRRTSKER